MSWLVLQLSRDEFVFAEQQPEKNGNTARRRMETPMKLLNSPGRRSLLLAATIAARLVLANGSLQGQAHSPIRPGPDILYEAPAKSPQLENAGIWKAFPILISGVSAYRNGEFLYQDYLYDDRGAGQRALYPKALKDQTHDNAADLVEVRIKPTKNATAVRITYNTLLDPEIVAATLAFGDAVNAATIPFGASGTEPASVFVTVHGHSGVVTDAATGKVLGKAGVVVDMPRRQVEVLVPYEMFDSRAKTVRVAAGTGLWDVAKEAYLAPDQPQAPPPPEPGAARGRGNQRPLPPLPEGHSLFFNVAFRYHEPLNVNSALPFYNDQAQSAALASGDLSPFFADVDFAKLASGITDDSGIPKKGFMNRIVVSHFESAQGRGDAGRLDKSCKQPCIPQFAGRLQPYSIYVPDKEPPASGYGLTLDLHSASATYARWVGQQRMVEEGERGTGSIVVTPFGRGLTGGYYGQSGADVFEVWADVARLYKIDPDYVALTGLSMGAIGSFKLAGQFPDLFAAAAVQVGCPSATVMRNHALVPFMLHTGDADVLTNCRPGDGGALVLPQWLALNQTYVWRDYLKQPHPFSSIPRDWQPYADFLGMKKRASDPAHVVYGVDADMDEPLFGLNSDHAYWVSQLTLRDLTHHLAKDPADPVASRGEPAAYGLIDVFSHGFGKGDPVPNPVVKTSGSFSFGVENYPWPNYDQQEVTWGPAPDITASDEIDVKAENIATVTIDPKRAKVSCRATVHVDSDGPITVKLLGCPNPKVVMEK
jgi:hypothetical protein